MENTTRFDLNAAIKNWRQEINGHPQLTAENCRELDAHLTDTVRELQKRGLGDEESFWLARRRVGDTQQVAEEFAKADPARLWRERVFWMACAVLALSIWQRWTNQLFFLTHNANWRVERLKDGLPDWVAFYLPWLSDIQTASFMAFVPLFVSMTPLIAVIFLIKKNYWPQTERAIDFLFKSRGRFVLVSTILCAAPLLIRVSLELRIIPSFLMALVEVLIFNGPFIALIAWLMPVRDGRKRKA